MTEVRLGTTPSQTVGPYVAIGLDWPEGHAMVAEGTPGAVILEGRMYDGAGNAIPDGMVEVWQPDPAGRFPHPADPRGASEYPGFRNLGRSLTDSEGRYWFRTLLPGALPIPGEDGEVEAPHFNLTVFARGLMKHLVTRVYLPGELANLKDPVFRTLDPADRDALTAVPLGVDGLRFDIHLQGAHETPFFQV
ncbi:protocatechuate 3,4-dioxygenase subunit alpha [Kribbella sp. NBC_01245]|uniref:protocatechuate 3,4-dioxygenase subunit alpha n=1 Tax=Kribbella sp. NBC_01245 TaxID=2903578 RepID=UPI002E2907F8|nr:protocatechuate 3,4-dioxygenase subunit alpha [Kribbella sp. NBC_01245]